MKPKTCKKCGKRIWGTPIKGECGICATTVEPTIPNLIRWLKIQQKDTEKNIKYLERKLKKEMDRPLMRRDRLMTAYGERVILNDTLEMFVRIKAAGKRKKGGGR